MVGLVYWAAVTPLEFIEMVGAVVPVELSGEVAPTLVTPGVPFVALVMIPNPLTVRLVLV